MLKLTVNGRVHARRRRTGNAAALGAARPPEPARHQVRVRHLAVRRLHGAHRRRAPALLHRDGGPGGREEDRHHRGPGQARPAQDPEGLDRARGPAVRLLPDRDDHVGRGAAREEAEAHRRGHRRRHDEPLPLRHLRPRAEGDPRRRRPDGDRRSREERPEESRHDRPFPATPRLPEGLRRRRRRPRPRVLLPVPRRGREGDARHGGQRLGGDPPRRPRRRPHRALRDGAGHLHGARPARRRGARLRLDEGLRRVRLPQRARPAQPHLGLDVHGRQPGRAQLAGLRPQGRRGRARDAGRRRRGAVEGARRRNAPSRRASSPTGPRSGACATARSPRRPRSSRPRRT